MLRSSLLWLVFVLLFAIRVSTSAQTSAASTRSFCHNGLRFDYPQDWLVGETTEQEGVITVQLANKWTALNKSGNAISAGEATIAVGVAQRDYLLTELHLNANASLSDIMRSIIAQTPQGRITSLQPLETTHGALIRAFYQDSTSDQLLLMSEVGQNALGLTFLTTTNGESSQWESTTMNILNSIRYTPSSQSLNGLKTYISDDCLVTFNYPAELTLRDLLMNLPDDDYAVYLSRFDETLGMDDSLIAVGDVRIRVSIYDSAVGDAELIPKFHIPRGVKVNPVNGIPHAALAVFRTSKAEHLTFAVTQATGATVMVEMFTTPGKLIYWERTAIAIALSAHITPDPLRCEGTWPLCN